MTFALSLSAYVVYDLHITFDHYHYIIIIISSVMNTTEVMLLLINIKLIFCFQASMDLPPDKAKVLKSYDDEKKWDLICDQVSYL